MAHIYITTTPTTTPPPLTLAPPPQICFPDTPETTRAFYLTPWERTRARERLVTPKTTKVSSSWASLLPRIFGTWQVYAFTLAYSLWSLTAGSYIMQYFELYLKAQGYSTTNVNNIPTAIGAVNFFFMIGTGFVADKLQSQSQSQSQWGRGLWQGPGRGPVCLAVGLLLTWCYAVLTAWHVPHPLRMAVYILIGSYGCYTPLLAGWANEACRADPQKRAFVLAFMVSVGSAVVIPFQQLQFPSSEAPAYARTHGYASALAFVVALTLWTGVGIPLLQRWQEGKDEGKGEAPAAAAAATTTTTTTSSSVLQYPEEP